MDAKDLWYAMMLWNIMLVLWDYPEYIVNSNRQDPLDNINHDMVTKVAEMIIDDIIYEIEKTGNALEVATTGCIDFIRNYINNYIEKNEYFDIA